MLPVEPGTLVHICAYRIHCGTTIPFLQFLLQRETTTQQLVWPAIRAPAGATLALQTEALYAQTKSMLREWLVWGGGCVTEGSADAIQCQGMYGSMLFVKLDSELDPSTQIKINDISMTHSPVQLALVDEILHTRKVGSLRIHASVTNAALVFPPMVSLQHSRTGAKYETPVVGFVSVPRNKAQFVSVFGVPAKDNQHPLGPFYYFVPYDQIDIPPECVVSDTTTVHPWAIVRFALFLGERVYPVYANQDVRIDNKDPTKEPTVPYNPPFDGLSFAEQPTSMDGVSFAKQTSTSTRYELDCADYDGLWSCQHTSVLVLVQQQGVVSIVTKEYEQQIPLSYHL